MDYSEVTEVPGDKTTHQAISMLYTRYAFAASYCGGKDVIEVGCGTGVGLGYLAERATGVIGGDYTDKLLLQARRRYGSRFPLLRLDACALPFRDNSFDVVILFEAIYYLDDPGRFLGECRRVLKKNGVVLICSANKERYGFKSSPFSVAYFSANELRSMLMGHGFEASAYAAFPVSASARRGVRGGARWLANSLRLNDAAKSFAKRVLFGRLPLFPSAVTDGMGDLADLVPVGIGASVADYAVVYAVGRLR